MYGRMHSLEGENRLLILMIFFILVWINAIGEDAFEKPFITIPYYFFWGVVLRMNWYLSKNFPQYPFKFMMAQQEDDPKS
jgi:hypothetical protein